MDTATARLIRERAGWRCEYCRVPQSAYKQRFQVDHVIARKHHGASEADNYAFCCVDCNLHKGPNIAGIDPETRKLAALFHPREHRWREHFDCHGARIVGKTDIGRATVDVLNLNDAQRLGARLTLIEEGLFPPTDE